MAGELSQSEARIFQDLVASDDEDYDRGIEIFESALANAERMLNENGGIDSIMYEDTVEQLNQSWQHFEQPVTVTGRVYASGESSVDLAPESWGEGNEDQIGTYFIVDSAELISLGIVDISDGQQEGGVNASTLVRFAYGLNPSDLESNDVMFFAFPQDLLAAKYEYPTLEGIHSKLHHRWPKEMRAVDMLIIPGERDYDRLIRQLHQVAIRTKEAIDSSEQFHEWLTRYLYDRIEFDQHSQYCVTCFGPAWYQGGDDEWMPFEFTSPRVQSVFPAGLSLSKYETGIVPSIYFLRPAASQDPESFTEQFSVPITSIISMSSTRPTRSLFESINNPEGDEIEVTAAGRLPEEVDGSWRDDIFAEEVPPLREIDQLIRLDDAIKQIRNLVDMARRTRYESEEAAVRESRILAEAISGILSEAEIGTREHLLRVEGEGVALPQADIKYGEGYFRAEIAHGGELQPPKIDEDIQGHFDGVNIAVMQYFDKEKNEVFHLVHPQLAILVKDLRTNLAGNNYPLMPIVTLKKGLVNLDGSAEITIPRLQQLRHQQEVLARLSLGHRNERVLKDVTRLVEAFEHETADGWTDLIHPSRLRRLALDIAQNPEIHQDTIDAVRQLLINRKVKIVGNLWQDAEHLYGSAGGIIEDVRMGRPGDESAGLFIVMVDEPNIDKTHLMSKPSYVEMSSLTHLAF